MGRVFLHRAVRMEAGLPKAAAGGDPHTGDLA